MSRKFKFFNKKRALLSALMLCLISGMVFWGPHNTLDVKLYYSGDEARALFAGLDAAESRHYFINELFDLLFIITYTAFLLSSVRHVFARRRIFWSLLAFLPGAFDWVETTSVLYILKAGEPFSLLDYLGIATCLKWTLGALVSVLLLGEIWRRKNTNPS